MNPPRQFKLLPRLPIGGYLFVFFILSALCYALIGAWMLQHGKEISELAMEERQLSATSELRSAMLHVQERITEISNSISQWEEARQQLMDPTYYEYWHTSRAMQAGYIPHYVQDLELYDAQGVILLKDHHTSLPFSVPVEPFTIHFEEGLPYLYSFSPVSERGETPTTIGFIGLKVDFHQALLDLNRFIYADVNNIYYHASYGPYYDIETLLSSIIFLPRPIAEIGQLEQLMHATLQHFAIISLLLLLIGSGLVFLILYKPLHALSRYINALRQGYIIPEQTLEAKQFCINELELLRHSIVEYQQELEQMHCSLDQKNSELWMMAHHDALTGVQNRRAYEEDWQKLQQLMRGQRIDLSVLLIDCDHFKAINDSYGHGVGDTVLQTVANILQRNLRDGDQVYRLGGDEFAIHLLNSSHEDAERLATRCVRELENYDFKQFDIREPVRFSVGIASGNGTDISSLQQLHKHADSAMYQAKRPNSSKIILYNPSFDDLSHPLSSNRFISAIYRAIESGHGIEMHYQPVLNLNSAQQGYHEVLLRLRDEEGVISPLNIFPIIEAEGLAVEMDYAIIRHLAELLRICNSEEIGRISINIDGDTLMHHNFMEKIEQLKPYLRRVPGGIVLEITETAFISELREASQRLQQLRDNGFLIALDDFGSGYSSLRYLASMPVDIIKFDIDLVRDLQSSNLAQSQVTADIARMILRAGYHVVAEGVDSEPLLQQIKALGFTHAQGYLLGKPGTAPVDLARAIQQLGNV